MPAQLSQEFLFERIRELVPASHSLVDTVAEILHVSNDSAYRRIRGETPLVLDEAGILCAHFNLSLDQLLQVNSRSILFEHSRLDVQHNDYDQFLKGLLARLKQANGLSNPEMFYCSKDLPVFHNFYFRPVFAFRYFFWMRTLIQHPEFVNRKFTMDCLPASTESISKELGMEYCKLPSVEILNTECINSMISQLEFCKDAGYFNNIADLVRIYDALEATILHLKDQVEYGSKFLPGEQNPAVKKKNFRFYFNRVLLGDNTVMIKADEGRNVFLNYEALSFLSTADRNFCNGCQENMEHLMKKGSIISATSEKQRNIFFGILLTKVSDRKNAL